MWIEKNLSEFELQGLCGALVHNLEIDQQLKSWQFVKPVPEKRFKLGKIPQEPIIKLSKSIHAEHFFKLAHCSQDHLNTTTLMIIHKLAILRKAW